MADHDHYGEYAEERHRHYDLERDDEAAQRDIRRLQDDVRELRTLLDNALDSIRGLDRLRPTCTACHDATATQQTASGPACAECVGDPDEPTNREIEPEPDGWHDGPDPEDYDPGTEADDEGGMSEYRYILAEDYQRGQS